MTDRERAIVMAYTGIVMLTGLRIDEFYKYITEIMGRPVYSHELAIPEIADEIKERARTDFLSLCA